VTIETMTQSAHAFDPGSRPAPGSPAGPGEGPSGAPADAAPQPDTGRRRAYRRADSRVVGGVAGGIADHLNVPDKSVRLAFIAITVFGGFGPLIYAALWFLMPLAPAETLAPGLEAATRGGRRSARKPKRRAEDVGQLFALVVLGCGVLLLIQAAGFGISGKVFWPLVFAVAGLALIWRQADETKRAEWSKASPRLPFLGVLIGKGGFGSLVRLTVGLILIGTAITVFLAQSGRLELVDDVLVALLLAVVGIGVIAGPWVHRLTRDLSEERSERIRTQERADMAAHLHDSVLQTLALIQKQAGDPRAVVRLARSQERDLRSWLYDEKYEDDQTLSAAAKRAAAEVEDSHGIPVEVVTVGDCPLTESLSAMVRAARESMVNAAKHSGAEKIDVFVEVDGDRAEMFVRDRGKGFDAEAVPDDRLGLRHSVIGRMERHGGRAQVRSGPDTGTEVRLEMDR
jgi:signal transduction histidine kinase/phage shock protein PspC (stress-responsive transcriptional regulator)